jgi:hypothetical protein
MGHVARRGIRNAHKILVGGPQGKRPVGRGKRRWEDNIKVHLREIGFLDVNRIYLAQVGTDGRLL